MTYLRTAAALSLPLAFLVFSNEANAQATRQVTAIERRIQTMDKQSQQYEIENMGSDDKKPKVDANRARQIKKEIEDDLNNLQKTYNNIVLKLQDKGMEEWYFHARRNEVRQMSQRLKKNLSFSKEGDDIDKSSALPPADTERKMLRSLATLIYELVTNPVFESTAGLDIKQAGKAAQQLDALIEFTAPGNSMYGPLKFGTIFAETSEIRDQNDVERFEQAALSILRKNCNVDFIDDGTNYWVLRMMSVSSSFLAEIDKCRSHEQNAAILNRRSATSPEKLKVEELTAMDGLIRVLSRWKDIAGRKRFVEVSREFLRRWESDTEAQEMIDWLKTRLPKEEQTIKTMEAAVKK